MGREIVEAEQHGKSRAAYGTKLLESLAGRLRKDFGDGYSIQNLRYMRQFYLVYPHLISDAARRKSAGAISPAIRHTVRGESGDAGSLVPIGHTPCGESWEPGLLHPNLAWSLYRHLIKVDAHDARAFCDSLFRARGLIVMLQSVTLRVSVSRHALMFQFGTSSGQPPVSEGAKNSTSLSSGCSV